MVNNGRIFAVSMAPTVNNLVERLSCGTAPLCLGIYHSGLLFLNDSMHEQGERVFAVMSAGGPPTAGRHELDQVATLNVSRYNRNELSEVVAGLADALPSSRVVVQIDGSGHCCPLCA